MNVSNMEPVNLLLARSFSALEASTNYQHFLLHVIYSAHNNITYLFLLSTFLVVFLEWYIKGPVAVVLCMYACVYVCMHPCMYELK